MNTILEADIYASHTRQCANRVPTSHALLRLILAAFVLFVYTSLALNGVGVARADDGPSGAAGQPGTTSASASQQSGSGSSTGTHATSGATSGTAPHSGVGNPPNPAGGTGHEDHGSASAPYNTSASNSASTDVDASTGTQTVSGTIGTTDPIGQQAAGSQHTAATTASESGHVDVGAPDHTPATVDATDPTTTPPATAGDVSTPVADLPNDASHNSKRSVQPTSAVTPASAAEPSAATGTTPNVRAFASIAAKPVVPINAAALAAVTPSAALATVTPSAPVPAVQPSLGLQLGGLVADVGTIAVSAVHTVASVVAQAFGPSSFLGVPYLLATAVANAAAAVGRNLVGGSLFDDSTGPFPVTYGIFNGLGLFNPASPPAGADDPSIKVTPEHPLPIILINGTIATQGLNWSVGAPVLANAGYKVYSFNYGDTTADPNFPVQAIGDIRQSGLELAAEVNKVLDETGAKQVILIGHSQGGGILPEYYINNLGGAAKVSQLIGVAPSNHGTDVDGLVAVQSIPILGPLFVGIADALAPALFQQAVGSSLQQEVYGDGDTRPGVLYTTISSVNDEIVTPYTQQALIGPNVTNIVIQDVYPGVVIGHANIITSPVTLALVLGALASNPAANPLPIDDMVAA